MKQITLKANVHEHKDMRGRKTGGVTATLCGGIELYGHSVEELREKLPDAIKRITQGPRVLHWRGWTILLFPKEECWYSAIIAGPDRQFKDDYLQQQFGYGSESEDFEKSLLSCHLRMAQLAWKPEDGDDLPEWMYDDKVIADFRSWVAFQRRYHEARQRGLSDVDAHDFAGRNPARPELWRTAAV